MDYKYETLLDQRFQMLCQSLLLTEYDNVKCFPVGKADGGRDATSHRGGGLETVFQVKFSHNPASLRNPAKWIIDALEGEKEKISKLKERGASRYVLITNAAPTANLDSGSIDKVDEYMSKNIPMEAICWWRDDLDRRLDNNYNLKLQYPSLLTGADMLRLLWENLGNKEESRRRRMTLNAYFAHQAEQDSTIRFKQAELLPSPLLDLFIDVPALPHVVGNEDVSKLFNGYVDHFLRISAESKDEDYLEAYQRVRQFVDMGHFSPGRKIDPAQLSYILKEAGASSGAADLLLDSDFTDQIPCVVLEGAPGQGKSTLSQYLAQLQRLRILDRVEDLRRVPQNHVKSAVMLPFKIELRDLALWIKGEDPWSGNAHAQHSKPRTLEGALAAHIEKYSGGFDFDVADMAFIIESRPVLIILDALDEVADLEDRHRVVEEVSSAVTRLRQVASRLKVLVTSRPTAVSGAPSFPQSKFDYLTLAAIPPKLRIEYAEKWGRARNLRKVDINEISQTLQQKMSAPHMAELAKNTMQLSILLSLIYHRGPSLPDKRTELYDAYIGSFFNREVEKSAVVREHRALLISVHQHLAYYMHAKAENDRTTGRIGVEELRQVVRDYLVRRKEPEDTLDALLTGMVERVVALVSRVEGTYEFEVQPLREYFAARYLYDTAPYVPATSMGHGTKPDRFDGIARNPYWMNVTRFFAGCFTSGELLDLAERMCSLCDDPEMQGKFYPRALALALLQDWVFAHSKIATERVLDKVFDYYGVRSSYLAEQERSRSPWGSTSFNLSLSPKTGSTYLTEKLLPQLFKFPLDESSRALAALLGKQSEEDKKLLRITWESEYRKADTIARVSLIEMAKWAAIHGVDETLFAGEQDMQILLALLKSDWENSLIPEEHHRGVILAALNSADQYSSYTGASELAHALVSTLPIFWNYARQHNVHRGILSPFRRRAFRKTEPLAVMRDISNMLAEQEVDFGINLEPWRQYTDIISKEFGETWNSILIGLMSGAVRARGERGNGAVDLFDSDRSICDRVRNAKRRSGQADWWLEQLEGADGELDKELWFATAYCWASPDSLVSLWDPMEEVLESLPDASFERLANLSNHSPLITERNPAPVQCSASWIRSAKVSSRMLAVFFGRIPDGASKDRILRKKITEPVHSILAHKVVEYAWDRCIAGTVAEDEMFRFVKKFYGPGVFTQRMLSVPSASAERRAWRSTCQKAIVKSDQMPDSLLASAEYVLRETSKKSRPVLRTANKEKWFD
ncbi:NACHT domain-containing protein [Streptomyces desertarenae]|uniref:NACHT domain-containing protein n=1 Tax=Streptomyces desertarenae TaxID=2666184 RepID=A0ABW4PEP4_9ACTN